MSFLCLYFKVHQPFPLKKYHGENGQLDHAPEYSENEEMLISKVADECYLPANEIMLDAIIDSGGKFKVNYSISGTALALMQQYRPDVIESFQQLVATGCVEITGETYYHSLSFIHSKKEFQRQVLKHSALIEELFGVHPVVFQNTELIYNNKLAEILTRLGFKGILCEGIERLLRGRTPNRLYAAPGIEKDFSLLLRNVRLSDDIAFRFDDQQWDEHPLTAEKFAEWIQWHPQDTEVINLFMDYETFGVHKKKDSGIFNFLKALPSAVLQQTTFDFATPSEVLATYQPTDAYNVENTISWEDHAKENCIWSENAMQNKALKKIYGLEKIMLYNNDESLMDMWGKLQSVDYFFYMAEGRSMTGGLRHINPYETPEEVFNNYMNIVTEFEISLITKELQKSKAQLILPAAILY